MTGRDAILWQEEERPIAHRRCRCGGGTIGGWLSCCLFAGITLASTGAAAWAQPCEVFECGGVSVADGAGFDVPDPDSFVPDRRPAIVINLFGGACTHPPIGGPSWWLQTGDRDGNGIVDSVDELILRLDDLYADGWRRIILHLPAGSYSGQLMSSSQWWTMPASKRAGLSQRLSPWLATHFDTTLGVYVGFRINNPCSLCMSGCDECSDCGNGGGCVTCPACENFEVARLPDTTNAIDMCAVANNVEPWVAVGVDEIWFDAAAAPGAELWLALLHLSGNPDYLGIVKFVGEPIPAGGPGGGMNVPIPFAIRRLGFVAARRYFENVGGGAPAAQWTFDPTTTEIHMSLRSDDFCIDADAADGDACTDCPYFCDGTPDGVLIDIVHDRVTRGYIPYARWTRSAEMIRRIYDIGPETIKCPGDLDADGDVDFHDISRLTLQLGRHSDATLYHGDLDFDGDVDVFDWLQLLQDPDLLGPCSASSP